MFQSAKYVRYIACQFPGPEQYRYEVVDSEFVDYANIDVSAGRAISQVEIPLAVINVYEKRNLPVLPNLIRAILYVKGLGYTISNTIEWNKECNPKFKKYEQDLAKYLAIA